mmetsp:Transcript_16774/g.46966  ORF Transcript_16774/g.46966 Transcript_16774/m.46966 type:complete len:267 (-) Transcript_16774:1871-2671(-)
MRRPPAATCSTSTHCPKASPSTAAATGTGDARPRSQRLHADRTHRRDGHRRAAGQHRRAALFRVGRARQAQQPAHLARRHARRPRQVRGRSRPLPRLAGAVGAGALPAPDPRGPDHRQQPDLGRAAAAYECRHRRRGWRCPQRRARPGPRWQPVCRLVARDRPAARPGAASPICGCCSCWPWAALRWPPSVSSNRTASCASARPSSVFAARPSRWRWAVTPNRHHWASRPCRAAWKTCSPTPASPSRGGICARSTPTPSPAALTGS